MLLVAMSLPQTLDVIRLLRALKYSIAGLRDAARYEVAFRQEVIVVTLLVPIAFVVGDSGLEWALLIGALILVLIVELLNSALETVVDRIGLESNDLSRRAKDLAAAGVLLSLVHAAVVWGLIIFHHMDS